MSQEHTTTTTTTITCMVALVNTRLVATHPSTQGPWWASNVKIPAGRKKNKSLTSDCLLLAGFFLWQRVTPDIQQSTQFTSLRCIYLASKFPVLCTDWRTTTCKVTCSGGIHKFQPYDGKVIPVYKKVTHNCPVITGQSALHNFLFFAKCWRNWYVTRCYHT